MDLRICRAPVTIPSMSYDRGGRDFDIETKAIYSFIRPDRCGLEHESGRGSQKGGEIYPEKTHKEV